MLKFIKKLFSPQKNRKNKQRIEDISKSDNENIVFIRELLNLIDESKINPLNVFLVLLQYLASLSGEISLKDNISRDLSETELFLDKFIKDTHTFLNKRVNDLNKVVLGKTFTQFYSNTIN